MSIKRIGDHGNLCDAVVHNGLAYLAGHVADDPVFRRNFAAFSGYGLPFDLQVFAPQMEGAARLAADFPKTTFILQHAGMLEDLSPEGRAAWRTGMARLATCPNVVSKLSGLGTFIHRNDPAHIAEVLADTVMILHRPGRFGGDEDNVLEVHVAKQRNGPTGEITLTWQKQFNRYENYIADAGYSDSGL